MRVRYDIDRNHHGVGRRRRLRNRPDHRLRRRTPRVGRSHIAASVAVAGLIVGGCAAAPAEPAPVGEPAGFATPSNADGLPADAGPIEWDDDHTRVVVTTESSPLASARVFEPAAADSGVGSTPTASTWAELLDRGVDSLGEPSPLLRPVPPADEVEVLVLGLAPGGAFVVVDDDGIVAEAGRRYLRTLTELYDMAALGAALVNSDDPPAAGTGDDVGTILDQDDALIAEIMALPGVVDAQRSAPGLIGVTLRDADDAAALDDLPGVVGVTVDGILSFGTEPRQGEQWMIDNTGSGSQAGGWPGAIGADTGVDAAWEVTTGSGMVVAVIDSGVDTSHPDLAGRLWSNPGEVCGNGADDDGNGFVDDCRGWDFGGTDADPNPDLGAPKAFHGTHVAGLVAAERNGYGVVGMAPGAQIMALKVSNAAGNLSTSWVAGAIQYAVAEGADVINLSLGSGPGEPRAHHAHVEAAVEYAAANGVVVVAAMGNLGVDTTYAPVWPADFARYHDNVVAVGASTNSDTAANFSNRGEGLTVWAPGWWLLSTVPGGGHEFASGTSMAAPVVAGAAALIKASGSATSPDRIRTRITATAAPTGAGPRLDAAAAVGAPGAPASGAVLSVSMAGAESLVADEPSTLEWVVATDDVDSVAGVELLVAARVGGSVSAVEGLTASLSTGGEPLVATSDELGSLGVVPVGDAGQLRNGLRFSATMSLPSADYGFVVRAVDADGADASDGYVTFVSVASAASGDDDSAAPADPGGVAAPGADGGAGSGGGSTPPGSGGGEAPAGGGDPGPDATPAPDVAPAPDEGWGPVGPDPDGSDSGWPDPEVPGTGSPGADPNPGEPVPPPPSDDPAQADPAPVGSPGGDGGGGGLAPAEPSAPSNPGPVPAPDGGAGAGADDDTDDATPRSESSGQPTPSEPTAPAPGAPSAPTAPPPEPVSSGDYAVTAISPNSSPLWGGVTSVLDGRFPTNVAIWVWYGDGPSSVTRAFVVSDRQLLTTAPPTAAAGTRDIVVRFSTDEDHELRFAGAFTYVDTQGAGGSGAGSGTGSGGGSVGGGGQVGSDPVIGVPADPAPTPGVPSSPGGGFTPDPPTPPPAGGTGGDGGSNGSPPVDDPGTTPAPSPTNPAPAAGGPPAIRGQLGAATLREVRSDSALFALVHLAWPDHGCRSTCTASRIA